MTYINFLIYIFLENMYFRPISTLPSIWTCTCNRFSLHNHPKIYPRSQISATSLPTWFNVCLRFRFMVFNATYNISVILWLSVLLVECPKKTIDLLKFTDKLYHMMLYRVHLTMNGVQTRIGGDGHRLHR